LIHLQLGLGVHIHPLNCQWEQQQKFDMEDFLVHHNGIDNIMYTLFDPIKLHFQSTI
jgi:hypothetical protein